jgi:hypothetical protein
MTWKLYPSTKKATLEQFGKMNAEMDAKDAGSDVKVICRLSDLGEGTGMVIADCKSASALQSWCYNWTGACELTATPVCTDNEMRRVINKQPGKTEPTPDPLKFDDSMDVFYMTYKIDRQHIGACMSAFGKYLIFFFVNTKHFTHTHTRMLLFSCRYIQTQTNLYFLFSYK